MVVFFRNILLNRKFMLFLLVVFILLLLFKPVMLFASGKWQHIKVLYNSLSINYNDEDIKVNNYLFNGRTYIELRNVSKIFNKNIEWDSNKRNIYISDKELRVSDSEYVPYFPYSNISFYKNSIKIGYGNINDNSDSDSDVIIPMPTSNNYPTPVATMATSSSSSGGISTTTSISTATPLPSVTSSPSVLTDFYEDIKGYIDVKVKNIKIENETVGIDLIISNQTNTKIPIDIVDSYIVVNKNISFFSETENTIVEKNDIQLITLNFYKDKKNIKDLSLMLYIYGICLDLEFDNFQ